MTAELFTAVQRPRLRKLVRRLIDIYSPSGKEEEILAYLSGYLKRSGLPVTRQEVDDSRYNLLVIPPDMDIRMVFVGHLDTVSAYDLDSYEYEEKNDEIFGLGAADMKGGCAAMIEAYLGAHERLRGRLPVALALVVGEEEEGDGAQELVREHHFPWAVIAEPTDLRPCLGEYGYIETQVVTGGKRKHASLASPGQSPVETLLRILIEFSRYHEEKRPELIYNIRDLFSSPEGFVVPDRCEAWIDSHLPPDAPIGDITLELEEIVEKYREKHPHPDLSLRFTTLHSGFSLPEKGPVVDSLRQAFLAHSLPWQPEVFRSHSDANILWEAGVKPIILGPGQLEKAHAPEESISFVQACLAAELFHDMMVSTASQ